MCGYHDGLCMCIVMCVVGVCLCVLCALSVGN